MTLTLTHAADQFGLGLKILNPGEKQKLCAFTFNESTTFSDGYYKYSTIDRPSGSVHDKWKEI
jgi:hypothetical protein